MKKALACTMLLGVVWSLPAAADPPWQFKGGVGVHPLVTILGCPGNVTPPQPCLTDPESDTVTPSPTSPSVSFNIIRGVHPGGMIWEIDDLVATVQTSGKITVNGKGLVLASGNIAGRAPTPPFAVIATLICETASPFTEHTSSPAGVLLSPTGDFQINDTLAPPPAATCASPMLFIRNAATTTGDFPNRWLAVGKYRPNGS
jgi:hypothetical protein